jgi:hypothetical protein
MKSNMLIVCTDNSRRRHLAENEVPALTLRVNVAPRLRLNYFAPPQPSLVS